MPGFFPQSLYELAACCPFPLYAVGGSVRDLLAGDASATCDWDICAPAPAEELIAAAKRCGFDVRAVYRNTQTVKLRHADGTECEYRRFRSDRYVRGVHTPAEIVFTDDIALDARRRDFCANAVYYDLASETFCDPLNGAGDIRKRVLRTVAPAKKVFGEDGLRLARLARLAAQTGFLPDEECLAGARENSALILDIAPERIFTELRLLLSADGKRGEREAPFRGLRLLHQTGVLQHILPELAAGDGMRQRADFHKYDVLEHSFRCVRYAPPDIRFAALLHDVGKPFCMLRDGNFYAHAEEGARLAADILTRLKAPKALTEETRALVALHMRDYRTDMRESKVRREIVRDRPLLEKLLALRQADYTACRDDPSPAPGVVKWRRILEQMRAEGVPMCIKELAIGGDDLAAAGVPARRIGPLLNELLAYCTQNGALNTRERLLHRVRRLTDIKGDTHV